MGCTKDQEMVAGQGLVRHPFNLLSNITSVPTCFTQHLRRGIFNNFCLLKLLGFDLRCTCGFTINKAVLKL